MAYEEQPQRAHRTITIKNIQKMCISHFDPLSLVSSTETIHGKKKRRIQGSVREETRQQIFGMVKE